jgi:hypothetical protein
MCEKFVLFTDVAFCIETTTIIIIIITIIIINMRFNYVHMFNKLK